MSQVVHNASIMNAVGCTGLQLYRFGQTTTVVFWTERWRPTSFYERIVENQKLGLHTLCLLDIKVKEQSEENMARGKKVYEPPRYMTVNQCLEQLLEAEQVHGAGATAPESLVVGVARVGQPGQVIRAGPIRALLKEEFGPPLHSVIVPGHLHDLERDFLQAYWRQ